MTFRPLIHVLALSSVLLLATPGDARAAEVRNGPAATVAPDETVNDDLFTSGQTVTVAGRVTGDVYAAGGTIVVSGTVEGDLIAAAQQVVVDGVVSGDVRAIGATVTVNGQVGHSVTSIAQQVNISSNGRVDGGLVAAGETITTLGPVGRSITAGGGRLLIGGPVGGEVMAWTRTLSLSPTTRIVGDLQYHAETEAAIPDGSVAGQVQYTPVVREEQPEPLFNGLFDFGGLVWLVGTAILGALAITFAPRASAFAVEIGRRQPLQTFGLGLLALFAVPIAGVLIAVTVVGLPVALVVASLYVLGLVLAKPALGLVVGMELARLARGQQISLLIALLVGLIVLHLVAHVPVLGGLAGFVGIAFGLGLLVQSVRRWRGPSESDGLAMPGAAYA